jgi:hypothetical protein
MIPLLLCAFDAATKAAKVNTDYDLLGVANPRPGAIRSVP